MFVTFLGDIHFDFKILLFYTKTETFCLASLGYWSNKCLNDGTAKSLVNMVASPILFVLLQVLVNQSFLFEIVGKCFVSHF